MGRGLRGEHRRGRSRCRPTSCAASPAARPELDLLEETSLDLLGRIEIPDAVILDGDHNYFTLAGELRLIAERSAGRLPLLMFHDVGWPHGRRDSYYAPERIPDADRQPVAENAGLAPGNPGTVADGLPFAHAAEREGGERNGVLTAIEDFMAVEDGLRLAQVPAFFGFGVLWREDAAYAEQLAAFLDPFDGNPVMARLEANRVAHLIKVFALGRASRARSGRCASCSAQRPSRWRRRSHACAVDPTAPLSRGAAFIRRWAISNRTEFRRAGVRAVSSGPAAAWSPSSSGCSWPRAALR